MAKAQAVLLLVSTGGRNDAERLGEGLVEERLAACASVIPVIHSFYRWEGRMQREHESLLLVKTSADQAEAAQTYVKERHTYELPEIIRIDISGGSSQYLDWLLSEVQASPGPDPDSSE